ncbi:hypothetical protein TRVL_09146 [Trypanosoma vivax]|nr:hypothetical protein TRVL_09146 [Trypanosoma vivax]
MPCRCARAVPHGADPAASRAPGQSALSFAPPHTATSPALRTSPTRHRWRGQRQARALRLGRAAPCEALFPVRCRTRCALHPRWRASFLPVDCRGRSPSTTAAHRRKRTGGPRCLLLLAAAFWLLTLAGPRALKEIMARDCMLFAVLCFCRHPRP